MCVQPVLRDTGVQPPPTPPPPANDLDQPRKGFMGYGAISGAGLNQPAVFSRSGFLIKPLPILEPSKWKETSALSTHASSTPDTNVGRF